MKWPVVVVLTIVASVAGAPRDAWAWGDEGHKVVCEIAMRLVQPTTRTEIQKLISRPLISRMEGCATCKVAPQERQD
jgi:hypothetical protein